MRVGTSGWSYPAWVGPFYPPGTAPAGMLAAYAAELDAVEAHATYRRLPTAAALGRWVGDVPPTFRFAPKAHLGITHRRDLEGVEERVTAFVDTVAPLGSTLGPVLFSLPHKEPDLGRLDRLLGALDGRGTAAAFELAPAWHRSDVLDRLDAAGATLVASDTPERPIAVIPGVGPAAYLRLRRGHYTPAELDLWAERLAKVAAEDRQAYAFFRHDDAATGPHLARELAARLDDGTRPG